MNSSRELAAQLLQPADLGRSELAERLTMAGLEVEAYERGRRRRSAAWWSARSLDVERHPNADKLTRVHRRRRQRNAASRLRRAERARRHEGAARARCGARLRRNMEIKSASLRGVESAGHAVLGARARAVGGPRAACSSCRRRKPSARMCARCSGSTTACSRSSSRRTAPTACRSSASRAKCRRSPARRWKLPQIRAGAGEERREAPGEDQRARTAAAASPAA